MPIRRYLFLGLTLVLIIALTNLVIRGCRLEKEQAQQLVETVEEAKPSPTRVLNPQDLKITQCQMELQPGKGEDKKAAVARHVVEIHNGGSVAYKGIQLKLFYLGRRGETLDTRTHPIADRIAAGTSLKITNVAVEGIPSAAAKVEASVASADIEPANPPIQ